MTKRTCFSSNQDYTKLCFNQSIYSKTNRTFTTMSESPAKNVSYGQQRPCLKPTRKWIIKRELQAKNILCAEYGETNNVWTHHNVKFNSPVGNQSQQTKSDSVGDMLKVDLPYRLDETNRLAVGVKTFKDDKDKRENFASPKFSTSKNPNFSSVLNSSSPEWLSRSIRSFNQDTPSDRFSKGRFLGNKLISKELHRNLQICRELIYRKSILKLNSSTKNKGSPNSSNSFRKTYDLPLRSQNNSEHISPSTWDYSKGSSSTTSDIHAKSIKRVHFTEDETLSMMEPKDSCCSNSQDKLANEHKNSALVTSLQVTEDERSSVNESTPFAPHFKNVSKEKLCCQELLDYFWSYQGISRQVLGNRTPYISVQSAMWEQEKLSTRDSEPNLQKSQKKQLNYDIDILKYSRLPPIPGSVTNHVVPLYTTNYASEISTQEFYDNVSQVEKSLLETQGEKKRYEIFNSPYRYTKEIQEASKPELQQKTGRSKLLLVVKIPHQQKREGDE